jgi:hypothetical protein
LHGRASLGLCRNPEKEVLAPEGRHRLISDRQAVEFQYNGSNIAGWPDPL